MRQTDAPSGRDSRGRFQPGMSGNPAGKKPGTRNHATLLREALADGEAHAMARKLIELALAGNLAALRYCLDRIDPVRRGTIELDLPEDANLGDVLDATLQGVVSGEIPPREANQVATFLKRREALLRSGGLPAAPPAGLHSTCIPGHAARETGQPASRPASRAASRAEREARPLYLHRTCISPRNRSRRTAAATPPPPLDAAGPREARAA